MQGFRELNRQQRREVIREITTLANRGKTVIVNPHNCFNCGVPLLNVVKNNYTFCNGEIERIGIIVSLCDRCSIGVAALYYRKN